MVSTCFFLMSSSESWMACLSCGSRLVPGHTPFSQLRPTYFRATQYQSMINVDMSWLKSNLAKC